MGFAEQMKARRKELGLSRAALAARLGISVSAIGNYENGLSTPKDDILLRLFDALDVEPNYLFRGSFTARSSALSPGEMELVTRYRALSLRGKQVMCAVLELAEECGGEKTTALDISPTARQLPLFFSPAAAGYAAPILGEDYQMIAPEGVPSAAQFALRISGDRLAPHVPEGSVVYVTRAPLENGDVGLFSVENATSCRQYYKDELGWVHLLVPNRVYAEDDLLLAPDDRHLAACLGKLLLPQQLPLPGRIFY